MIVKLDDTTTNDIGKSLLDLRHQGGAVSLSRVLTLIIVGPEEVIQQALTSARLASSEHPCRVVAVAHGDGRAAARLDAEIRVGGDAGASETILLRLQGPLIQHDVSVVTPLLLPDSPIVVWWPADPPKAPALEPIGALAQRRVTDAAQSSRRPITTLKGLADAYSAGDTDMSWARLTLWRSLLAALLDVAPYEQVTEVRVEANDRSPSGLLLAAWLGLYLRCPAMVVTSEADRAISAVHLTRASGTTVISRPQGNVATLAVPGKQTRKVSLPHRDDSTCVAEELRRLDSDEIYEAVLTRGLPLVTRRSS